MDPKKSDSELSEANQCCQQSWLCNPKDYAAALLVTGLVVGAVSGVLLADEVNMWLGIAAFFLCMAIGYVIGAAIDNGKCCRNYNSNERSPLIPIVDYTKNMGLK